MEKHGKPNKPSTTCLNPACNAPHYSKNGELSWIFNNKISEENFGCKFCGQAWKDNPGYTGPKVEPSPEQAQASQDASLLLQRKQRYLWLQEHDPEIAAAMLAKHLDLEVQKPPVPEKPRTKQLAACVRRMQAAANNLEKTLKLIVEAELKLEQLNQQAEEYQEEVIKADQEMVSIQAKPEDPPTEGDDAQGDWFDPTLPEGLTEQQQAEWKSLAAETATRRQEAKTYFDKQKSAMEGLRLQAEKAQNESNKPKRPRLNSAPPASTAQTEVPTGKAPSKAAPEPTTKAPAASPPQTQAFPAATAPAPPAAPPAASAKAPAASPAASSKASPASPPPKASPAQSEEDKKKEALQRFAKAQRQIESKVKSKLAQTVQSKACG